MLYRKIYIKNAVIAAAFMTALGGVSACVNIKKNEAAPEIKKIAAAPAQTKTIVPEVNGFGTLSYQKKYDISASGDGVLAKLYVREGGYVQAGGLIAQLSNEQIDLALERAKNELASSSAAYDLAKAAYNEARYTAEARILSLEKAEFELAESVVEYQENERKLSAQSVLFDAGGVSEEAIRIGKFALQTEAAQLEITRRELAIQRIGFREKDLVDAGFTVPEGKTERNNAFINLATRRAGAELRMAEARFLAAEKELQSAAFAKEQLQIKAPASGTAAMRYAEEGERLKREDKIITLIDTESLYAIIPVQEQDALRVRQGMPARVTLDGTNETFAGTVDLVSPYAESQSFTFSVRILLPNNVFKNDTFARPGMFARAVIETDEPRDVLALDAASIVRRKGDDAGIFVVKDKYVYERAVHLGAQVDGGWEVTGGIAAGELVVLRPDSRLKDGEYVSLVNN